MPGAQPLQPAPGAGSGAASSSASVSARTTEYFFTKLATPDETIERKVAMPRNTASAWAHNRQLHGESIYIGLDRKIWPSLRRLLGERMRHQAMLRAVQERLSSVEQVPLVVNGRERPPDVLVTATKAYRDNTATLLRLLRGSGLPQDRAEAELRRVLASVDADPELQAQLRLEVGSEEDADSEQQRRIWRRKLNKTGVAVGDDARFRYTTHDSPSVHGDLDLHNKLSRATGEEGISYYQRQQLKSGRGRRGSTSFAGAWEGVFDSKGRVTDSEMVPQPPREREASARGFDEFDADADAGASLAGSPSGASWAVPADATQRSAAASPTLSPAAAAVAASAGFGSQARAPQPQAPQSQARAGGGGGGGGGGAHAAAAASPFSPGLQFAPATAQRAPQQPLQQQQQQQQQLSSDVEHLMTLLRNARIGVGEAPAAPTPAAPAPAAPAPAPAPAAREERKQASPAPAPAPARGTNAALLGGTDALLEQARALIASSKAMQRLG